MSGVETREARLAQVPDSPHVVGHLFEGRNIALSQHACVDSLWGTWAGRLASFKTPPHGEQGALGAHCRGARSAQLAGRGPCRPIHGHSEGQAEESHVLEVGVL